MRVPLLDLRAHHAPLRDELHAALLRVADSQQYILGSEVDTFEQALARYLGCKHAIGVSSGTDALLLALMAIDVGPGDEVLVPTYSFFATAGVVSRLNARPVFVDIDPVSFNIDPAQIESRITKATKAIIPVHLYGQAAAMDDISRIAKTHDIVVIEDAAQALGAQTPRGQRAGTVGDLGCFSFFPSKNLGCFGDAGLVASNDDALGERMRLLRVHGGKPKYHHKVVGGNFRMDAIQAAVLSVKLPHLESWHARRRHNAALYDRLFAAAGLQEKVRPPTAVHRGSGVTNFHIYNQYVIRVNQRDALVGHLKDQGIGTEIYYPVPFHRQECFADLGHRDSDFPMANAAAETSLALPIYPELTGEQIEFVVDRIRLFSER